MDIKLSKSKLQSLKSIQITGSKSESNRMLILKALYDNLDIKNLSNSDDTKLMVKALSSSDDTIDIHHAGTAMRFLTAYFSVTTNKEILITGSKRMKERPIAILVDALKSLGAKIEYVEAKGYPPLKICPSKFNKSTVSLAANVSSQYISALLLIAPFLKNGLTIDLEGKVTSVPYIKMTLSLLKDIGAEASFKNNRIVVKPYSTTIVSKELVVESDWSSASYFYSLIALSELGTEVTLSAYKSSSLQGDSILTEIYKSFGVETTFLKNSIRLKKTAHSNHNNIELDLSNSPDIAQTIVVTCFGLGLKCELTGLHTLKIKETDRLEALKKEIGKLGGQVETTDKTLKLISNNLINDAVSINTYNDHRMAMAFAPLSLKTDIIIKDSDVVSKSYPDFWKDLQAIGIQIQEIIN